VWPHHIANSASWLVDLPNTHSALAKKSVQMRLHRPYIQSLANTEELYWHSRRSPLCGKPFRGKVRPVSRIHRPSEQERLK